MSKIETQALARTFIYNYNICTFETMQIIAQTPRFIIREYAAGEEELYLALFTDERVTPYLPKRDREQNREIFKAILADNATGAKLGKWGIFALDGHLIGFAMLKPNTNEPGQAELGYAIHHQYWNQGIVTEACLALLNYGFNRQQLHEITAVIVPKNVASERVLVKVGFTRCYNLTRDGEELSYYKINRK